MKNVFRKGYREFEFLNSRESRFMTFRDRFEAMAFLRDFFHDHYQMRQLRRLLERELVGINLSTMTDYGILERLADLLVSKHIRVVERYDLFESGFHAFTGIQEAEPVPPPEEEFVDEPEAEPGEPPPPAPPLDAAAQAEALKRAAQSGAPFCEA